MATSHRPYIGSRDFYPEEISFRNWMFERQRRLCTRYGYQEYAAPLLEPLELYRKKSSEEIVNEQLYRFVDRGEREVAIRPEMTPSLARMVSARLKETPRPIRWFSIANFMRYERPGRGRLREFYQLNVDLMGTSSAAADAEILMLAIDLLRSYGAGGEHFEVRYGDRRLLDSYLTGVKTERKRRISQILDKKEKLKESEFQALLDEEIPEAKLQEKVREYLQLTPESLGAALEGGLLDPEVVANLQEIRRLCDDRGYGEVLRFDPAIIRGFDYYTGFIFEIYDRDPQNRRSLFGGGRYDRLIGLFGKEEVPAVGFGLGDVTLEHFLTSHGFTEAARREREGVFLTLFSADLMEDILSLASELREAGIVAEVALEPTKKLGKQFELADRKGRRLVLIMGPEEKKNALLRIKDLETGTQQDVPREKLIAGVGELLKAR